jgi:hypothetical protein
MKKFRYVLLAALAAALAFAAGTTGACAAMSGDDFYELCKKGSLGEISDAIEGGVDVSAPSGLKSETPLMMAARDNPDPLVITALIQAGADVNAEDDNGGTALMYAAGSNPNPEVVAALVKAGADIHARDSYSGMSALDYAKENKNPAVAEALREADVPAPGRGSGISAPARGAGISGPGQTARPSRNEVRVSTVEELFAAVASETVITLEEGLYDLSKAFRGGSSLVIENISNLVIQAAPGANVEIVTPNRFAEVIQFVSCNGVALRGVKAGHSVTGEYECDAGVVEFIDSQNISVENCVLYGSGAIGISMRNCGAAVVDNVTITDCSFTGTYFWDCFDIKFTDCRLVDNRVYGAVIAASDTDATFTGCEISGNKNLDSNSAVDAFRESSLLFDGCTFKNNANGGGAPVISGGNVSVKNCVIEKNNFDAYWDAAKDLGGNTLQ